MGTIRCKFCHEYVDEESYSEHEADHLASRPDGQHREYVTLPPDERAMGAIDDVPKVYRHQQCGAATEMPEEIIRSYLQDPYLYGADATFCCGCGKHVPFRECNWVETGEDLQTYTDKLRAAKPEMRPNWFPAGNLRFGLRLMLAGGIIFLLGLGGIVDLILGGSVDAIVGGLAWKCPLIALAGAGTIYYGYRIVIGR